MNTDCDKRLADDCKQARLIMMRQTEYGIIPEWLYASVAIRKEITK